MLPALGRGQGTLLFPPVPPTDKPPPAASGLSRAVHGFIFPACPEMSGGVWPQAGAAQEEEEEEESEFELG